jgi:hypothetical protein
MIVNNDLIVPRKRLEKRLKVQDDVKAGERFVIGDTDRLSGPC